MSSDKGRHSGGQLPSRPGSDCEMTMVDCAGADCVSACIKGRDKPVNASAMPMFNLYPLIITKLWMLQSTGSSFTLRQYLQSLDEKPQCYTDQCAKTHWDEPKKLV